MKGFLEFIREQSVVGLAVGFLLGGAVAKLVASFVTDIINPIIGLITGAAGDLKNASFQIGPASIMYGKFISSLIDFIIIAFVVYFVVKGLKLDKLDKKKK
jgi:large conductance mechanosensitive channel